ncbi:MAG: hypothetical protein ACTTJH_02720 [Bacteroidales bacterium]
MEELLLILGITVSVIALCGFFMGIRVFLQRNGKFSHTCAFDWEKEKCKNCNGNCESCTANIGEITTR